MTEFEVYAKSTAGADPEPWEPVDDHQRVVLRVRSLSGAKALQESLRLDTTATHVGRGAYNEAYRKGRLLRDVVSDQRYMIEEVRETGRARRGRAYSSRVQLMLVEWTGWEDPL